jgi:hypothetical protein
LPADATDWESLSVTVALTTATGLMKTLKTSKRSNGILFIRAEPPVSKRTTGVRFAVEADPRIVEIKNR